jgi:predicted nuclease of predicted toxin-antitoxin system
MTRLADIFPDSSHVQFHDLTEVQDSEILEFAKAQGFCFVKKGC